MRRQVVGELGHHDGREAEPLREKGIPMAVSNVFSMPVRNDGLLPHGHGGVYVGLGAVTQSHAPTSIVRPVAGIIAS